MASQSIEDTDTAHFAPGAPLAVDWAAYRGRWVALIGDQIAGVGETPEAARLAARHSRPRERISEVRYVSDV